MVRLLYDLVPVHSELIVILRSACLCCGKTVTDLKALDGTDGEDCLCEVRVQLLKYRLAETYRKTGDHTLDDTADGVAFRDLLVKIILRCLCCLRIRKTEAVILDLSEIHPLRGNFHRSDGLRVCGHGNIQLF